MKTVFITLSRSQLQSATSVLKQHNIECSFCTSNRSTAFLVPGRGTIRGWGGNMETSDYYSIKVNNKDYHFAKEALKIHHLI